MKKAVVLLLLVLLVSASFLKGQQPSQGHKELPEQYWTDIVTEQPAGYVVDANGNVHIYSAEGLAWLSVLSNGLHGQEAFLRYRYRRDQRAQNGQ